MISLNKFLAGALMVGAMGGLIYAQPSGDLSSDDDLTVTAGGSKQAQMSPADMLASADDLVNSMHADLRHVTQLRDKAAAEKDIIKLNCINDKLMPMKAEVNLGDHARRDLDDAISHEDARYAVYADVVKRNNRAKDLREQADACVGDALTYVGKTDVQVTGPDNPLLPPTSGFGNEVEPPGYRTPFD